MALRSVNTHTVVNIAIICLLCFLPMHLCNTHVMLMSLDYGPSKLSAIYDYKGYFQFICLIESFLFQKSVMGKYTKLSNFALVVSILFCVFL